MYLNHNNAFVYLPNTSGGRRLKIEISGEGWVSLLLPGIGSSETAVFDFASDESRGILELDWCWGDLLLYLTLSFIC